MADNIFADQGTGANIFSDAAVEEEQPGFIEGIGQNLVHSVKAAGFMVGIVKAANEKEAESYRRQFAADAAATIAGLATGGTLGAVMKGGQVAIPALARTIITGALTGSASGAAYAGVKGEPIVPAAVGGGIFGGALSGVGHIVGGAVSKGARAELARESAKLAGLADDVAPEPKPGLNFPPTPHPSPGTQMEMFSAPGQLDMFQPPFGTHVGDEFLPTPVARMTGIEPPAPSVGAAAQTALDLGTPDNLRITPEGANAWRATAVSGQGVKDVSVEAISARTLRDELRRSVKGRTVIRARRADQGNLIPRPLRPESTGPQEVYLSNRAGEKAIEEVAHKSPTAFSNVVDMYKRWVLQSGAALNRMGEVGKQATFRLSGILDRTQQHAIRDVLAMDKALKGLSKSEMENVAEVLNGSSVPVSDAAEQAAGSIRLLLNRVRDAARGSGIQTMSRSTGIKRAFTGFEDDYFPLTWTEESIKKFTTPGSKMREDALKMIMETHQAANRREAEALLTRWVRTPMEIRDNHLQLSREAAMPGWDRDVKRVLSKYFLRAWKRIETANEFGADDSGWNAIETQLRDQGHDDILAKQIWTAFNDRAPIGYRKLIEATRTFNIVSLLDFGTGVLQFGQHANIAAREGFKNYLKGTAQLFTKEGRAWAEGTGAALLETIQDIMPSGERGLSSRWTHLIGLEPLDKANRFIAALAGRERAKDLAAKVVQGLDALSPRKRASFMRDLARLGLNADQVAAQGGRLTPEQLSLAGLRASNDTQFRSSVLDLPAMKNTTAGQFIYLFRSFAIQQFRFVRDLVTEARKGNAGPLIKYASMTGTLGAMSGETVRQLRGKKADDPWVEYAEAVVQAGALGIGYDALRAAEKGPEMIASFVGGPTAGQAASFLHEGVQAAKGNPDLLLRDAIKHVPLFGRTVANYLVPLK